MEAYDSQIFDPEKLEVLKPYEDENGQCLCISLVNNFLEATPSELDQLSQALGDKKTFTRLAHTLKSTAAVLGGVELAQICADLENREMSDAERGQQVQRARDSFLALKQILITYVAQTDWKKHG